MIFIGGVHGVGKTSFCNYLSKKYDIITYSASRLIEQKRNEQFASDKKIGDISGNQNILLDAIMELIISEEFYLLDGHFCLINKEGTVSRIPESTFLNLSPRGIIVLVDLVETILARLKARDSVNLEISFLAKFQNEELKYSREIANRLNIPYLVHYKSENLDICEEFLRRIILMN